MKTIKLIIAAIFFSLLSFSIQAQPPDPPGGHGGTEDEGPGGGAPLGSGIGILIGFAAAYAAKKTFYMKKVSDL